MPHCSEINPNIVLILQQHLIAVPLEMIRDSLCCFMKPLSYWVGETELQGDKDKEEIRRHLRPMGSWTKARLGETVPRPVPRRHTFQTESSTPLPDTMGLMNLLGVGRMGSGKWKDLPARAQFEGSHCSRGSETPPSSIEAHSSPVPNLAALPQLHK